MPFIAFDLEGPISPNDHAYELMSLFPGGQRLFEILSRYDDLLVLEGRENYQPGDTLSLILPFLALHGLGPREMGELAEGAALVEGAGELISRLKGEGWGVGIITTTYQPYALRVAGRVGVAPERVAATPFPSPLPPLSPMERDMVARIEGEILGLPRQAEEEVKQRLDRFFWQEVPFTPLSSLLSLARPVGGERKVAALRRFHPGPLREVVVVGDSITDFPMLKAVEGAGGMAVAFNANQYALPYATLGLASTHISDLLPLLQAWVGRGREGVEGWVKARQREGGQGYRGHFHWVAGEDFASALPIHQETRRWVRSRAAALG